MPKAKKKAKRKPKKARRPDCTAGPDTPCDLGAHGRFARTVYVDVHGKLYYPGQTDQSGGLRHARTAGGVPVVNIGNWPYWKQFSKAAVRSKQHKKSGFPIPGDRAPGFAAAVQRGAQEAASRRGWLNNPGDDMYNMNPYRRKRKSVADDLLEFEEYAEDEAEGLGSAMTQLSAYELNPPHLGQGPHQRVFGAGGGYTDSRGRFHPGGGRYLDPNYLPSDYPEGTYHPGGGQVSRGYHPGSGYFSNPNARERAMGWIDHGLAFPGESEHAMREAHRVLKHRNPPCGCGANCGCGCGGDARYCSCPVARNPGRGPRQREWGAGGGHYDRSGWHAGGGRYMDPDYLPSDYPEDEYHPGGGHVIGRGHRKSFWPGSGYSSNPYGGSMLDDAEFGSPYSNPYGGSMLDDAEFGSPYSNPYGGSMLGDMDYASPYESNPYLRRPPRDLYKVPAFNNPAPYAPAAFGYGHLPYAARVAPGLVTLANPPHHYCPNCGYDI